MYVIHAVLVRGKEGVVPFGEVGGFGEELVEVGVDDFCNNWGGRR